MTDRDTPIARAPGSPGDADWWDHLPPEPRQPEPVARPAFDPTAQVIKPRPYQTACVDHLMIDLADCVRGVLAVLPTGAGKTVIFSLLVKAHRQLRASMGLPGPGRILILAHRDELIGQAEGKIKAVNPDVFVNIEQGPFHASFERRLGWDGPDVVIASVQSLCQLRRLRKFTPSEFDLIIIDECHHCVPKNVTYWSIIKYFREGVPAADGRPAVVGNPAVRLVGVTATADRSDREAMGQTFDKVSFVYDIREAIDDGWLVMPVSKRVKIKGLNLGRLKKSKGDLKAADLTRIMSEEKVGQGIANATYDIACEGGRHRPTLVFWPSVDLAKLGAEINNRRRPGCAVAIHGETERDLRRDEIKRFNRREFQFLHGCGVFLEGFDAPIIEIVAIGRPTMSRALYCLDDLTEVLTPTGWKFGKDLTPGEIVAAVDVYGVSRWERIAGYVRRPLLSHERMMAAAGPSVDLRMTNTHRLLYSTKKVIDRWDVATVGDVSRLFSFKLPACGLMDFPGIGLTDDEIRFVGLAMTDGHYNPLNNQITLYQSSNSPVVAEFEKCLIGCGFKFTRHSFDKPTNFGPRSAPLFRWTVSRGLPRGRDKHLTGWDRVADFFPKLNGESAWDRLDNMTDRQFGVLLEAMHVGDGAKQAGQTWNRGSYHISMKRAGWASRIQRMAAVRGWRCSVAINRNGTTDGITVVHLKKTPHITVGGTDGERTALREVESAPGEQVWCISVPSGAFVSRRNGKVVVVGNCQMVGRGLRPLEGVVDGPGLNTPADRKANIEFSAKPHCTIIDFVGNTGRHRLVCTDDLLGGVQSGERGDPWAKPAGGNTQDQEKADEQKRARAAAEDRRAENREGIVADVTYEAVVVDAFDALCIRKPTFEPPADRGKRPTENMIACLQKAGVDVVGLNFTQAKKLVIEVHARRKKGLATFKQLKLLKEKGHPDPGPLTFDEAKAAIEALRVNGWKSPWTGNRPAAAVV